MRMPWRGVRSSWEMLLIKVDLALSARVSLLLRTALRTGRARASQLVSRTEGGMEKKRY
jgi:hypothetical protein